MSTDVGFPRASAPVTSEEVEIVREQLRGTGRNMTVSANHIALRSGIPERRVRRILREMNFLGIPVVGYPTTGFWIAGSVSELENYASHLRRQAAVLESRANQVQHLTTTLRAELSLRR